MHWLSQKEQPPCSQQIKKKDNSTSASGYSVNFLETAMTNSEQAENSEIVTNIEPSHNGPICPLYLKNSCPHGTSGKKLIDDKECDKYHPKCCHRFVKEGPKSKRGCRKGKNCDFFQPVLCKYSLGNRRCTNKECTFVHLPGTKRWPESEDRAKRTDLPEAGRHTSHESIDRQGRSRSGFRAKHDAPDSPASSPHLQGHFFQATILLLNGQSISPSATSSCKWKIPRHNAETMLSPNGKLVPFLSITKTWLKDYITDA